MNVLVPDNEAWTLSSDLVSMPPMVMQPWLRDHGAEQTLERVMNYWLVGLRHAALISMVTVQENVAAQLADAERRR